MSLDADRKKEEDRRLESFRDERDSRTNISAKEEEECRLELLRAERDSRTKLIVEPDLSNPHIVVSIRHPTLGNRSRIFSSNALMIVIYDWVGSLSTRPEHFELLNYSGTLISPDQSAVSGNYNVRERDSPINMSQEGSVSFSGFGVKSLNNATYEADEAFSSIIFGENVTSDENDSSGVSTTDRNESDEYLNEHYQALQLLRLEAVQLGNSDDQHVQICRDSIYKDMLSYFSSDSFDPKRKVIIDFKDEDAVGDGVSRDGFTLFFQKMYAKFEGCYEKVPMPALESDELIAIGKIISTGFIFYNIFPFRISHACLKYALCNDVSNDELFKSFMNFITPREATLVKRFAEGRMSKTQPFIDILSEAKIYEQPTKDNIYNLCIKASKILIIKMPSFSIKEILTGMGTFWNKVDSGMLDSVKSITDPTPDRIVNAMNVIEESQTDQKVTTWLHRFIRSSTKNMLFQLVRFVTGSSNLIPGDIIRVEYIDQSPDYVRPIAETCFMILRLPRQYVSFSHLNENMSYYLNSEDLWVVSDAPILSVEL